MKKTIFFDLDGTLTDSALGITNSVAYALKKMEAPPLSFEERSYFVGPPLTEAFAEKCGFDHADSLRAIAFFREYYLARGIWENKPYPGVSEMLCSLRDAGDSLRVATSKPEEMACRILEKFELLSFFDRVDGAPLNEELSGGKDAVLQKALTEAKPDGRAIMVGDRKYDVLSGRRAGLTTVAVRYGYGSAAELTEAGPDHTVFTVMECESLLRKL